MNILLVEDNRILQVALKRALGKAGHDVNIAASGEEGISEASRSVPDLVLLDLMLPTVTGTSVLRALKEQPATKDVPVFVLTGLSRINEKKLLEAGATKFFEKTDNLLDQNFADLVAEVDLYRRD